MMMPVAGPILFVLTTSPPPEASNNNNHSTISIRSDSVQGESQSRSEIITDDLHQQSFSRRLFVLPLFLLVIVQLLSSCCCCQAFHNAASIITISSRRRRTPTITTSCSTTITSEEVLGFIYLKSLTVKELKQCIKEQ